MKKMCSDISDEVKGVCSDVSLNTCRKYLPPRAGEQLKNIDMN